MPRAKIVNRFGSGVVFNLIGTLFNQGSTLVTNIVIARALGADTYGKYVIVLSTLQSVSLFAGLGMGYTATRYLPELRIRDRVRASRILGLGWAATGGSAGLITLLLLMLAPLIAARMLRAPDLTVMLRLGAGVVFGASVAGYFTGVLAALDRYGRVALGGIVSGILYTGVCIAGAFRGGLAGAVGGLLISAMLQAGFLFALARASLRAEGLEPTYRALGAERTVITKFVVPAICSSLTSLPALWLAQVALVRRAAFGELGKYSAAYTLAMIVLFLPNVAQRVGMSLINDARGTGNTHDYRRVFWANLQFTVAVVVAGVLGMSLIGPVLLRAYGPSFRSGVPALFLLLAATLPEALTIAMSQLIQTNDRMWEAVLRINLPRDVLIPVLAFHLAPAFGASGVAAAYLCGRIVAALCSASLCRRIGLAFEKSPAVSEPMASLVSVSQTAERL